MTHIDCEKSLLSDRPEVKLKLDGTSWNVKDDQGKKLADKFILTIVFFIAAVILFCIYGVWRKKFIFLGAIVALVITISIGTIAVINASNHPMTILYSVSQYATKLKKTPPVMNALADEPVAAALEENYKTIKDEVYAMLNHTDGGTMTKDTYAGQNNVIGADVHVDENGKEVGWKIINVHMGKNVNGVAKRLMPTFTGLMKEFDVIASVISVLPAKTKIPPHIGYSSLVKRLMFAIEIPTPSDRCYLCVNGEKITWTEGKTLLWDDCYAHGVWNETTQRRIVIYMDLRRITGNKLVDWFGRQIIKLFENSKVIQFEIARTETKKKIE